MNQDYIIYGLLLLIIIILLFLIFKIKIKEYRNNLIQRKRFQRGVELEHKARIVLEKKGFKIIKEQYIAKHIYMVNGVLNESELKVDYLVKKNNKKYLVEVKTGKSAPSIKDKDTRRQLLEYDFAIENDGIFLLDMENEELLEIKFLPKNKLKKRNSKSLIFFITIILIFIIVIYFLFIN